MSELIFKWAGMILLYIVGITAFFFGLVSLAESLKGYFDRVIYRIESNAVRQLAGKILRDHYWFSEDPVTAHLLQTLGKELADSANYDVSLLRDSWRWKKESMAKESTP